MDQETELLELSGTVEAVKYKNEENGYTVLLLRGGSDESITVVGCFPYAAAGESMLVSGTWMTHPTYGRQFKAEFAQRLMPTSEEAIYAYLAGGSVKGIRQGLALQIVNRFGDKSLDILENHPERLAEIKGISLSKARDMAKSFSEQVGMRRLMEFICSFSLRPILAMRMYKFYGEKALPLLRGDPYLLSAVHIGGSFAEADRLALEMGMEGNSPSRIAAAVLFELRHNSQSGHCFIPREKLCAATAQLISVEPQEVDESIDTLIETEQLVYEEVAGCRACYLPELHAAESGTAERLSVMCRKKYKDKVDVTKLIEKLESRQGIKYAPLQMQALELALKNQLVVITGGPGTGKTTSIRGILALFEELELKTLLTAPTGRAAKRMSELSGREAQTVHRLLEAKFDETGEKVVFGRDEDNRLDCDAVILDECSMVDIALIHALLRAMPPEARLVMVGDADQLPSVGPGNVFSAVIRSQVVPTVRLTEIFRQNEGSRIVRNAHLINKGEHPDFSENAGDFFRLRRLQAAGSVDTVAELCAVRLPNKMHIPPEEIQVLSPTRRGEMGTANLNMRLQAVLNPPAKDKKEKLFGSVVFREGDRVMQIKNNYDIAWYTEDKGSVGMGIYNGDIGVLRSIDLESESLTVSFDGRLATYGFDSLLELEHAWAMTVHKSQGSEYRAVVLALSASSPMLMTRDVLYTAITRAKSLLVMVGDDGTAYRMIDNFKKTNRYTALRVRLRRLCGVA